jgi:hypothetical protein
LVECYCNFAGDLVLSFAFLHASHAAGSNRDQVHQSFQSFPTKIWEQKHSLWIAAVTLAVSIGGNLFEAMIIGPCGVPLRLTPQ